MPLSEKTRIEIYIPELPAATYGNLLAAFDQEFMYTFGGATIVRGLAGSYLSLFGSRMEDSVNLIYTDAPFAFEENFAQVSRYTDELRNAAFEALAEEAILVVAFQIYRSE